MSTLHTPGPWDESNGKIFGTTATAIATVHKHQSPTVTLANARLIVAAPELLEALSEARRKLAWFVESYPQDLAVSESEFFQAIDAAITKATPSNPSPPCAGFFISGERHDSNKQP